MFITNILKGFSKDTKINYYIGEQFVKDIRNVDDWLKSGLCSSIVIDENDGLLTIKNDTIIIKLHSTL